MFLRKNVLWLHRRYAAMYKHRATVTVAETLFLQNFGQKILFRNLLIKNGKYREI